MLSRIVTKIVGRMSTHAIAQKEAGRLYTWGSSGYSLGRPAGEKSQIQSPEQVIDLDSPVVKVTTGKYHALIMTKSHTLYGVGCNTVGQLASSNQDAEYPQPIEYFKQNKVAIQDFASGDYHNLALLQNGSVLSWGATGPWKYGLLNACYIDGNSLGLGTKFLTRTPEPIESLSEVTQVTAGDRFSLALKSDGRVFGWGSVFGGRLLEQTGMIYKPQELTEVARFLNKKHTHITKICSAGSYTVMLCDNGKLYTFGKSFDGCTGHRQNELINEGDILQHVTPVIDDNYKGQVVSDFKMSPNALIFQTNGGIYYTGMGLAYKPKPFPNSVRNPKAIFATDYSVGVITEDNKILYICDKILEQSDLCQKTKVYMSEDERLNGNIQQIGGHYGMKYAIIA